MKVQQPQKHPLLNYEKKWVAMTIDGSVVFTSGNDIAEVENKLKGRKRKDLVISYVPPFDSYLSPFIDGAEI